LTSTTNTTICSNQLPYSWNGQTYNAAGTYSVILTSSSGCDSVATIILTVNSTLTSTTNTTICSNQLPYSWNGQTYNAAGTYSVTLTSSSGCDSVATIILTVNNTLTSTTNVIICPNQAPYSWNGHNYDTNGSYSVTLTSSSGCDSIATLVLTINPDVTSTTNATICSNQLPYSWNGQTYNAAGTYSVTLTSSSGCDSVATLQLTVNPILTSSTNVTVCQNQLPYSWNGQSYNSAGNFNVTLTGSTGCDSIATLHLAVNPTVSSTTNATICSNQLPYSWNGQTYNAAGTYSVVLTSSSGCDSIATLQLVVNPTVTSITNIVICVNQLPYHWNSQTYNIAGTYSVTLMSSTGCDSVATLHLTVNPNVASITNTTICQNSLPYNWNGQIYSAAGTYSVTLTSSAGCDSVATLHLTVNLNVTSTTNISVCSNQLPFNWNGHVYNAAGTYSVLLSSSAGCDSTAILNLSVRNVTSSVTNISICSNQLPYHWNGQSYNTGGAHAVTLTGSNGCDSVATLNLAIRNTTSSTTTASTCSNQLPYSWNGHTYAASGSYQVTFTGSNGCDSIATLVLTVNPVNTSVTNASTCSNQLPYNWNGQSYNATGTYSVTLVSSAGCDSIAKLNLVVNPVVSSTTNVTICSILLPYNWNGHTYNAAGQYQVTLVSSAGCDSVATLNLVVNQTPAAPLVNSPLSYCQYEQATALTASGTSLQWYTSATGGSGSPTPPVPSTLLPGIFLYYVSQSNGLCESPRAVITVKVNAKPALGPDKELRLCYGSVVDLTGLFNTSGLAGVWTDAQGNAVTNPATVSTSGLYQLVVQNRFGCADTAKVALYIYPEVIANAGPDANAEYNYPYQLFGSGGVSYEWAPTTPLNNPYVFNPKATLTATTTFVLTVTNEIGCIDKDTVTLRVLNGPTFYVPTAFSPNGDGLNDIFRPTAVGISSLDYFRVFNRYGELVFETSDLNKGWDGTYKGQKQPIDNYVWMIQGTDRRGELKTLRGNVVLVR
ncbi:MAG: gliding motility-associated C-terminal domain-containing protein, partial [Bacteroidetes bacterium]|nr:gliding motility-associated C-terminal domain-containing protein [Bacteroidota bacterium]